MIKRRWETAEVRLRIHAQAKICKTGSRETGTLSRGLFVWEVVTRSDLWKGCTVTEPHFTHKVKLNGTHKTL